MAQQGNGDKISVLHLPYTDDNPYQKELLSALARYPVQVRTVSTVRRLPLFSAIRQAGTPDLLHLHWTAPFWHQTRRRTTLIATPRFVLELLYIKWLGVKIVWTIHDLHGLDSPHPQFEHRMNGLFCRLYDHLIVHSQSAAEEVVTRYHLGPQARQKITVIRHGHFIDAYPNQIAHETAKRQLGFRAEERLFLYFGNIRPYKGVLPLIDIFTQHPIPGAHLLIAGQPGSIPMRQALEARCDGLPYVHLKLGHIPSEDVQLYMNAADIVVLPFQDIFTSGSVILAMSFGKALIIPSLGSLPEVVDTPGCIFYNPGAPDGLRQALQQAHMADLGAMGRYNQERVKCLDWDTIARQTLQVYQRCLVL